MNECRMTNVTDLATDFDILASDHAGIQASVIQRAC